MKIAYNRVNVTEVIPPIDSRYNKLILRPAKLSGIKKIKERKARKAILEYEVPNGANILGESFILSVQNIGRGDKKEEGRQIAQSYREKDKKIHGTGHRNVLILVDYADTIRRCYRKFSCLFAKF